jgi:hypothetical protein
MIDRKQAFNPNTQATCYQVDTSSGLFIVTLINFSYLFRSPPFYIWDFHNCHVCFTEFMAGTIFLGSAKTLTAVT